MLQMITRDLNTVPGTNAAADRPASPAPSAPDPTGKSADAERSEDAHMADAADAGATEDPEAGAEAARGSGASAGAAGKAGAACGAGGPPEQMPCPRAVNAMSVHEGSERIAVAQIGRPDHSITLSAFPEPAT